MQTTAQGAGVRTTKHLLLGAWQGDNTTTAWGRFLWRQNIVSTGIRTATVMSAKAALEKSPAPRFQSGTTPSVPNRLICRGRGPFRGAHNVGRSWQGCRRVRNVRSAALNCIRANSARISILAAASSAPSPLPCASRKKTRKTSVRFTKSALRGRKKPRLPPASGPTMPGRHLRICSRSSGSAGPSRCAIGDKLARFYGFCVGLSKISLTND